jgi:hypothetical protein
MLKMNRDGIPENVWNVKLIRKKARKKIKMQMETTDKERYHAEGGTWEEIEDEEL